MAIVWLLLACADPPLVVPNAPADCAGVFFTAPADPSCPVPEEDVHGELVGAEGDCWRGGDTWMIAVPSRDFRGEVQCVASGCASPRFQIADETATPSSEVMGTFLDAQQTTCRKRFPNPYDAADVVLLPPRDGPVLSVPRVPEARGWMYMDEDVTSCTPQRKDRGTVIGADGYCQAICADGDTPLLTWIFAVRAPGSARISCETPTRRSPDFLVGEGPASSGVWVLDPQTGAMMGAPELSAESDGADESPDAIDPEDGHRDVANRPGPDGKLRWMHIAPELCETGMVAQGHLVGADGRCSATCERGRLVWRVEAASWGPQPMRCETAGLTSWEHTVRDDLLSSRVIQLDNAYDLWDRDWSKGE